MDISILSDIGLTNAEIKVYLSLLKTGSSKTGPIIKQTGLQSSVIYTTLNKLIEKGLVSFVKKGQIKYFKATDPHNILKFIENKKQKLEILLPKLLAQQQSYEHQEVEIFEGFNGFKVMLYQFIDEIKKGDECLFFAFQTKSPEDFDEVYNYYRQFGEDRKRYGLKIKGIVPVSVKNKFKDRKLDEILFVDFPVPTNISVFRNKIIMTPWEDKKISFLIISRQLAESFRQYFYSIWDKYKK